MTMAKLQLSDEEIAKRKNELYQKAQLQILSRERLKRDVIRDLGFELQKLGVEEDKIATTIASELIHPQVFPQGSKDPKRNSKGQYDDISGQQNPEAGKPMVHPDYARRNLPEFMKDYGLWGGKEKLDKSVEEKKKAGHTTRGKKINRGGKKEAAEVGTEWREAIENVAIPEPQNELVKVKKTRTRKNVEQKEQNNNKKGTLTPSDYARIVENKMKEEEEIEVKEEIPHRRIKKKETEIARIEGNIQPIEGPSQLQTPEEVLPIQLEEGEVIVDDTVIVDPRVKELELLLSQETEHHLITQTHLQETTQLYDKLLESFKQVTRPFKQRKWVNIRRKDLSLIYSVGSSYLVNPVTRKVDGDKFMHERLVLTTEQAKIDDQKRWAAVTGKDRDSIDL